MVQEEGRFRQVYISFYTTKTNQLAQRIRQGGNIEFIEVIFWTEIFVPFSQVLPSQGGDGGDEGEVISPAARGERGEGAI